MEMQFATEAVNEQDFVWEARGSSSVSARQRLLADFSLGTISSREAGRSREGKNKELREIYAKA
ncbi:hypothetical protein K0M31_009137, partial [Melipona bicolor]